MKKTTPAVPESVRKMLAEHAAARGRALAAVDAVLAEHARTGPTDDLRRRAGEARAMCEVCAAVGPDDGLASAISALTRAFGR